MVSKNFCAIMTILFLMVSSTFAQNCIELDEAANEQISIRVRQEVNLFTNCLSFIVDKTQTLENRDTFKEDALNLFIGKGLPYYDYVLDNEGNVIRRIQRAAVTMEVTSLRNSKPRKKPMADYLTNLVNLANQQIYRSVSIESTNWHDMKVSKLQKIGENRYVCDVYFEQIYISRGNENRLLYTDKTIKRVTCFIEILHLDTGDEYVIALGDVTAVETKRNSIN